MPLFVPATAGSVPAYVEVKNSITADTTSTSGYSTIIPDELEIVDTFGLEITDTSVLEIT